MSIDGKIGDNLGENLVDNKPVTPEELLACLKSLNLDFRLYEHEAVFSVDAAAKVDMDIPGAHTRNLFIRDKKGAMFLVTLMAHTKIDLSKLAGLLGMGRISFGSPERLTKYLGVTPGSVTPFSIINDRERNVTLVLDADIMDQEIVNYHPLINTMTVGLTPKNLLIFLDQYGIRPKIVNLTPATAEQKPD